MSESADLTMTNARLNMLGLVASQRITYDAAAGQWCLEGKHVVGWQGRTLSELRRAEYIATIPLADGPSRVELTRRGEEALP